MQFEAKPGFRRSAPSREIFPDVAHNTKHGRHTSVDFQCLYNDCAENTQAEVGSSKPGTRMQEERNSTSIECLPHKSTSTQLKKQVKRFVFNATWLNQSLELCTHTLLKHTPSFSEHMTDVLLHPQAADQTHIKSRHSYVKE